MAIYKELYIFRNQSGNGTEMKHIILAGGSGTRLWPFSRNSYPKQFLHFGDNETLLQKTIKRFYPQSAVEDILVVTGEAYLNIAKNQLSSIHPSFEKQILVEPEKRNTAPAICLAVKYFQDVLGVDENECFLVSSADHFISPESVLLTTAFQGEPEVKKGNHLIFGIRPNKPETGYGYIKTKNNQTGNFLSVDQFVEKPDFPTAQLYLLSGKYLWNAGIFLFQIKTFLRDIQAHCPDIHQLMQGSFQDTYSRFSLMPDISIDYALMEKSDHLLVAPLDVTWSDVGSWDSVYDLLEKDSNRNVKMGNVLDIDTTDSLIMGKKRLISTVGLEDMIIVDTEDALFIGKKGKSQMVKRHVEEMKKRNMKESSEHLISYKSWGSSEVLQEKKGCKITRFIIESEHSIDEITVSNGNEHWIVLSGVAHVTFSDKEKFFSETESFFVVDSQKFWLSNVGKTSLHLIQIKAQSSNELDIKMNEICQTI